MSNYISFYVNKNFSAQYLNEIGKKYNLNFKSINSALEINLLCWSIVNCYLAEWISNEYDTAISSVEEIEENDIDYHQLLKDVSKICENLNLGVIKSQRGETEKLKNRKAEAELSMDNWTGFLSEIITADKQIEVALLLHTYSGDIETEEFVVNDKVECSFEEKSVYSILKKMKKDVLYIFKMCDSSAL